MSAPIENCQALFKFLCPKKWENLKPTASDSVRFCDKCRKNVYLCHSAVDEMKHKGDCIAVISHRLPKFKYHVGASR